MFPFQDEERRPELRRFDETWKISAAGLATGRPVLYDRKNDKHSAPLKAREGDCVVGRTANITKALEELSNQFKPQELNEANVQAIFNRCLPVSGRPEVSCELFPPVLGYSSKDYRSSYGFDKEAISANKKNIQYLFGQLHSVHIKKDVLTMDDFLQELFR